MTKNKKNYTLFAMRIEATPVAIQREFQQEPLSPTDWKVTSLVVISHFLITIGVALAVSSLYIAVAIHPMYAVAVPVVTLAVGVLGIQNASQRQALAEQSSPPLPKGFNNVAQNCWMCSIFQMLFHTPAYRTVLYNLLEMSKTPIGQPANIQRKLLRLRPLLNAYKQYRRDIELASSEEISKADPQKIREWLFQASKFLGLACPIESNSSLTPEDPSEVFDIFINELGIDPLRMKQTRKQTLPSGEVAISVSNQPPIPTIKLDLGPFKEQKLISYRALLTAFFEDDLEPTNGFTRDQRINQFETPPDQMLIQLKRFYAPMENGQVKLVKGRIVPKKIIEKTDFPLQIEMEEEHFGETARYVCDSFIHHKGEGLNEGHYTTYFKEHGKWYWASDDKIEDIPESMALSMIQEAALIHYQKTATPVVS